MSVARVREINARLRAAGFTVHEWPGWESRGNGLAANYEGGLVHHTASPFGIALPGTAIGNLLAIGRQDLSGPLCNWALNVDGSFTVIAAHPANHAGASGGRSMGPLPVTRLFNPRVLGLEIVYPGTVPMRDAQYRGAAAWARIVTDVCGYGNIERARAHAETSITGKFDPGFLPGRTIDMTAFRRAAAAFGVPEPAPIPQQEEDDMSVAYVKGDSIQPIPGTKNVWGDVVFLAEWDAQEGVTRVQITNPNDPGLQLWKAIGRPVHQVKQAVLDEVVTITEEEAAAAVAGTQEG